MKKKSVLRKVLAVALSAVTLLGTGFTTAGQFVGTSGVSVSAAEVYGDFQYSVNDDNTVTVTKYTGDGGKITIPDTIDGKSVTSIGDWAFYGCSSLTSVSIPNSVTYIGNYAFRNCTNLASISIPDSVTYIGEDVFSNCTGLTSITIPDSITSINYYAFYGCTGLTSITIPDSVTSIGGSAFYECTGLTSVTIGNSVTSIGGGAFSGCTGLKSINVGKDNEKYSSKDGVLFDKDKKTLLLCPWGKTGKYTIPDSVTSIGGSAFYECTGLTSIVIPDSVTEINGFTFLGCTGLTSVVIPDSVTTIGNSAFSGCWGLTSVEIPDSVTSIGWYAFSGCTGLTSVTIGNSVTSIGGGAFYRCTGLTSIVIPDSVTEIGNNAFGYYTYYDVFENYCIEKINGFKIYGAKGSAAETYANENNIPFVSEYSNISTISSDEIILGGTVTVNAKAVLGEGDYTYAVLYKKKADTKWTVKQNYSTNDTIVVKPAKATDYDVCVKVKDSTGKIVKKFFEVKVNAKLKNTSTISATTIKKGNTVTLNGSATGGMGGYTYAVLYKKKAETKWTVRQNYNTNSEILVRPYTNTDYDICIKVKDKDGTIVKKYFTVTVTK